ncbi:MAG: redoxin domain-containing protein [Gemmatimonadetes bacterium]|nr:redoxin domain-containing protein [Gemmatimonadota bacterium]
MRRFLLAAAVAVATMIAVPSGGTAQEAGDGLIEAGAMAPDFELTGATRHGVLRDKVRLSDYRGETVVLAFFFRVRTRG